MALYEGYRLWIGQQSIDAFKLALARRSQRTVVTQTIGAAVYAMGGGLWSARRVCGRVDVLIAPGTKQVGWRV